MGVFAAAILGFLLIGTYQDQKYPIQPDQSNLLEEVTWWVNRGYDQPVLDDIQIYSGLGIGEQLYYLIQVEDQLGMAYLEQGPNGNYRMAGSSYGSGNFHFEELEHDGVRFVLLGGKNEYFGIDSIECEMDDRVYRAELPPGDRFLTKIEIHPPADPDAPPASYRREHHPLLRCRGAGHHRPDPLERDAALGLGSLCHPKLSIS